MREQVIATQGLLGVAAKTQGVVAKMQGLDYSNIRIPSGPEPVFLYDAYSYRERGLARVTVRDEANRRNNVASQNRRYQQARIVKIYS